MKGRIDEHGLLEIYRGDENPDHYQKQYCPYQPFMNQDGDLKPVQCGCWCALFGEPHKSEASDLYTLIKICGKILVLDYFEDKRYDGVNTNQGE